MLAIVASIAVADIQIDFPDNVVQIEPGMSKEMIISVTNTGAQEGSFIIRMYDDPYNPKGPQIVPAQFSLVQTPDCNYEIIIDIAPQPNLLEIFGVNHLAPHETKVCKIQITTLQGHTGNYPIGVNGLSTFSVLITNGGKTIGVALLQHWSLVGMLLVLIGLIAVTKGRSIRDL